MTQSIFTHGVWQCLSFREFKGVKYRYCLADRPFFLIIQIFIKNVNFLGHITRVVKFYTRSNAYSFINCSASSAKIDLRFLNSYNNS